MMEDGKRSLFLALATDYDGTLALDGQVDETTVSALRRLKDSGKRLIMVTGREMDNLRARFKSLASFDIVVAENGAVLYFPETGEERLIAPPPPEEFVAALRAKGVEPLSVGRGIVATWTPHEFVVQEIIKELKLDWQIVFNKGAVMCLAPGINKASGLISALNELKLSPRNVVGVGDAENDQDFLQICGCSVAVANALESVKHAATLTTARERGAGVTELIDRWLGDPAGWLRPIGRDSRG